MREVAATMTHHGKLEDISLTLEGNTVWLHLDYHTGDASGQNMVTICTEAICGYIREHSPVQPRELYVEGNMSGDKKASAQAFVSVRGKKVTAEAHLSRELLGKYLHATPQMLADYWRVSALGGIQSGSIGIHGHLANGLAALYLATGQDAACVAESAIGVTHFEPDGDGIYAAVTLPAIMVGTVGGGTKLPMQHAWLELMGLAGNGKSRALAEVCAALLLAGELSIIAALAAGHFTKAHAKLARKVR
jgi:hydroxymethylglutaryl-CoA reductase (NADPH)